MTIKIGHYVTSKLGEIYKVTGNTKTGSYIFENTVSGKLVVGPRDRVKPFFLQKGDELRLSMPSRYAVKFRLMSITYDTNKGDYIFELRTLTGIMEILDSAMLEKYFDRFTA